MSPFKLDPQLEMPLCSSKKTVIKIVPIKVVPRHIPSYDEVLRQNFASTLRLPAYRFSHAMRYHPYRRPLPRFRFETESADPPIPPTPVILPQACGVIPFHYNLDDDDYVGEDEYDEEFELPGDEVEEDHEQEQGDQLAYADPVTILAHFVRQCQNILTFLLWIFSIV
ncbi:hypothetical protein EDD85DRAFT_788242 [Armillaria nabsnona]|nr:hypothetical protein EDD85DRAFT_788242 [Armillaria nabsnona]